MAGFRSSAWAEAVNKFFEATMRIVQTIVPLKTAQLMCEIVANTLPENGS